MKTRKLLGVLFAIVLVVAVVASGCAAPAAPAATSAPAPAAATTSAPSAAAPAAAPAASTSSATAPAASGAAKSLKVAMNINLQWPMGVDAVKLIQLDVDDINANGGLQVGSDKYKIELIIDDSKADLALAKTAAQKEIFQDGAKFIIGDLTVDSYLQLADDNKVVTLAYPSSPEIFNPKYKYCFQTVGNNTGWLALIPWMAQKYPDNKTFVTALPDNDEGHPYALTLATAAKGAGLQPLDTIFYPPDATDLSVVGTKVKALNPGMFAATGGGPQADSMKIKSLYQAGWKGLKGIVTPASGDTIMGIAGADAAEGLIGLAWPIEFDPPTTEMAKHLKDLYVKKYGKWEYTEETGAISWWTLKAALAKAASVDSQKVADVLNAGLQYESLGGMAKMVARPDFKNNRAVDTVMGLTVKQTVGGKVKPIEAMTVDQAYTYCKNMFGW